MPAKTAGIRILITEKITCRKLLFDLDAKYANKHENTQQYMYGHKTLSPFMISKNSPSLFSKGDNDYSFISSPRNGGSSNAALCIAFV